MEAIADWFMSLGENYGVNPFIFGSIYVGAIPFFTASIAWLVRNIKRGKPVALPILSAGFFFVSAYLYLVIVGKNIPAWVYLFIVALLGYGVWTTYRKVSRKVTED